MIPFFRLISAFMLTFKKRLWQSRIYDFRYYSSIQFAFIDLLLSLITLFCNPYRICRKFLQKKGAKNIYAYGETPLSTYKRIIDLCDVNSTDTWIELGSGRGRGCFWLSCTQGYNVIGIEWVPLFVYMAKWIKLLAFAKKISFECKDINSISLPKGAVIYLYGYSKISLDIPHGVKVISVSEPLSGLAVIKKFWVRYPWGRTTAFLQTKL